MIPFLTQPSVTLGPVTVHAFGAIVASAVLAGLTLGRRRFVRLGLDPIVGEGMGGAVVLAGFVGAHLFSVLFYFPRALAADPLLLFRFWEDVSSFGGVLGGLVGAWLFFRRRMPALDRSTRWAYLDVAAYVFPVALLIGRVACSLAHDHPGTLTTFPLAVSLRTPAARAYVADVYAGAGRASALPPGPALARLGFHDLGWYELLYLALVVVPAVCWCGRRRRPAGFFLALFLTLYLPVRFLLDTLRVSDVRYAGLTPVQWLAVAGLGALPALWRRVWRSPRGEGEDWTHVGVPSAASASSSTAEPAGARP